MNGTDEDRKKVKRLLYAYPGIARTIKFIRNIGVVHDMKKPSYLVKLGSLDNVCTLTSILTLTLCAFVEMLELWDESIEIERARLTRKA